MWGTCREKCRGSQYAFMPRHRRLFILIIYQSGRAYSVVTSYQAKARKVRRYATGKTMWGAKSNYEKYCNHSESINHFKVIFFQVINKLQICCVLNMQPDTSFFTISFTSKYPIDFPLLLIFDIHSCWMWITITICTKRLKKRVIKDWMYLAIAISQIK